MLSLIGVGSIALYAQEKIDITFYTQATFAALFHLINHATYKGALFMVIGIVDYQVGTRDIRRLGGLIALMPVSFTIRSESTRLNSSHVAISYAVFCLKKKKHKKDDSSRDS